MSEFAYTNIAGERCVCSCTQYEECNMECSMYRHVTGKQTNADRIRAMTDEELARWIATTADDNCPDTAHERYCDNRCGECWLDWLKSQVEDGE